jgi:hypothetical protein
MTGLLTYIAFLMILGVWAVGWLGISGVLGALLKVPPKVALTAGLVLGPLGALYVLFLGISGRDWGKAIRSSGSRFSLAVPETEDPFS